MLAVPVSDQNAAELLKKGIKTNFLFLAADAQSSNSCRQNYSTSISGRVQMYLNLNASPEEGSSAMFALRM